MRCSGYLLGAAIAATVFAGTSAWSGAAARPSAKQGRFSPDALGADGTLDLAKLPEFIPVSGDGGKIAGYARSSELFGAKTPRKLVDSPPAPAEVDVYDENLTTVIGSLKEGRGFVDGQLRKEP